MADRVSANSDLPGIFLSALAVVWILAFILGNLFLYGYVPCLSKADFRTG